MIASTRRYQLRHCLGRGGFGEVYLALMETGAVTAEVAVKLLNQNLDPGSQALERLRDEGRILGLLNHPVILKVHDLLVLQGRVALITEYVDGADLQQCFAAGDLPIRAMVEVIGRVADALGVAYTSPSPAGGRLELVHRDVKPENIRVGRHGDVKLLDFGIARAAYGGREAKTKTSSVIGTLRYMAPERFHEGVPDAPAADVFALGAALYEGLRGERLLERLTGREMYLLAMDDDEHKRFIRGRLDLLPADLPPQLRRLVTETLHFEAQARPTASEVAARCEAMAENLPGASLRRYCRDRVWAEPNLPPGDLDGVTLSAETESAVVERERTRSASRSRTGSATRPPAPPRRRRRWAWMAAGLIWMGAVMTTVAVAVAGVVVAVSVAGLGSVELAPANDTSAGGTTKAEPEPVPDPVPAAPAPTVPVPATPVPTPAVPTPVPAVPAPPPGGGNDSEPRDLSKLRENLTGQKNGTHRP